MYKQSIYKLLILALILTVASFFNFYQIGQVPPGLFADEATHALDALDTLDGHLTLYSPNEGSTGALWRYLLALHFAIFGATIFSLRVFASLVGLVSVWVTYLLVRELNLTPLGNVNQTTERGWREIIAVIAALLLTVSYWHVDLSRIAFSAVLMLLIQNVTFFFLWRAVASGRQHWFILFGLGVGLLAYNYLPGKLVPVMLVLFFLLNWLAVQRESLLVKFFLPLLVAAGLALLVALPIILFVVFNYQMLLERAAVPTAGAVASLSPLQGIMANLSAFGLWPPHWLSGRFFLGPVLTTCFVVGVGVSLVRFNRPAYLFLVVGWLVMLLPGALAPEGAIPHTRRAIGSVTATYALVALGLTALVYGIFWLAQRLLHLRDNEPRTAIIPLVLSFLAGGTLVIWTGTSTFYRYFEEWGKSNEAKLTFHVYDLELADIMARESGVETVYLLPLDSAAGIVNPLLDSITFVYRGQASYDFLPDDEETMLARLSELTSNKKIVRLLRWNVTKHTGADPKKVAHYYLEKWGHQTGTESHTYFDIDTYKLSNAADAFSPPELVSAQIDFERHMMLVDYAFGPSISPSTPSENLQDDVSLQPDRQIDSSSVPAGHSLWIETTWGKISDAPVDYQTGFWLEDQAGHVVGRVDSPLISNIWHQGTSQWPVDSEERSYHFLQIDPTAPPGVYRLKTVLYTADNSATERGGRRLAPSLSDVGADLAVTLGQVTVLPQLTPPDPVTLSIPQRLDLDLGEGLHLLGFDPGFIGGLRPGDRVTLNLWWRTTQPLSQNLAVAMGMGNDEKTWSLSQIQPLGGNDYPTSTWENGVVVQTFVDLRLPADVDTGEYNLGLRLLDVDNGASLADRLLGQVQVIGRPRSFEIPLLEHKIGADFGNQITLLGYDIDLSQAEVSGTIQLILYWQAQSEMDTGYKVFVHLLDESGQIVTQVDREPQAGEAPTTGWLSGEVVADAIDLLADEKLLQVSSIAIGLYNSQNGERILVVDPASERVVITPQILQAHTE